MHIDLSRVSAGQSILEAFPQLEKKRCYTQATDKEIKVAIFMCDPKGPFRLIKKYDKRLLEVFSFLKLDEFGDDAELHQGVLSLTNTNVSHIYTDYLQEVFDHEWVNWFSNSIVYYQMMEYLRIPIADVSDDAAWTRRTKIEARANAVYKNMKAVEDVVFLDDNVRKSAAAIARKIENFAEKYADENSVI